MKHRPLALCLCIILLMTSSCDSGEVGGHEDEEYDDYGTPTPTPDYDYTATFDYYYITGPYRPVINRASVIGQLTPVLLLGLAVSHMWG